MALAVDGLHPTRPIEYPVGSPEEADGMFDVLTYQKGGSVLRMLEQYLGPDTFRDGVRRYLKAHAYANTVTADLWAALEEASGEPVAAVMDSWILQGGHPLVALHDGTLHQRPFAYATGTPGAESAIGTTWQVPVQLRRLGETGPGRRLLLGAEPVAVGGHGGGTTVVNAGGWGVYRVGYDAGDLGTLARQLDQLGALERVDLFADTWAGVLAEHSGLGDFLSLAAALGDDPEPGTWRTVTAALDLCSRVVEEADRPQLAAATRALLGPRFSTVGWDAVPGEAERTPSLRSMLLGAARDLRTGRGDPGRGGPPLRRVPRGRRVEGHPRRHRRGGAGGGGHRQPGRGLRRNVEPVPPPDHPPGRAATPPRPGPVPRCRTRPGDLRPGHGRGAQPGRPVRGGRPPAQPGGRPGGVGAGDRGVGPVAGPVPGQQRQPVGLLGADPVRGPELARSIHRFLASHRVRAGERTVDQLSSASTSTSSSAGSTAPPSARCWAGWRGAPHPEHARPVRSCDATAGAPPPATREGAGERRRRRHRLRPGGGGRAARQDHDRHLGHGQPGAPVLVWVGASAAFVAQVALAVVAGRLLALLPHRALEAVITTLFLAGAVYLLFVPEARGEDRGEREGEADGPAGPCGWLGTAFVVIFLGEFGDLTQLLTVNLTRPLPPALVGRVGAPPPSSRCRRSAPSGAGPCCGSSRWRRSAESAGSSCSDSASTTSTIRSAMTSTPTSPTATDTGDPRRR